MVNINKVMPSTFIRRNKPSNKNQPKPKHNDSVNQTVVNDSVEKKDDEQPNKHIDERI
jgi:hypothetical protein